MTQNKICLCYHCRDEPEQNKLLTSLTRRTRTEIGVSKIETGKNLILRFTIKFSVLFFFKYGQIKWRSKRWMYCRIYKGCQLIFLQSNPTMMHQVLWDMTIFIYILWFKHELLYISHHCWPGLPPQCLAKRVLSWPGSPPQCLTRRV